MNWVSGLMGRIGNYVRAHALSAALTSGAAALSSGCQGDERIKMDTPGGIPPLPQPLPNETDPVNPTPRDEFGVCLPPDRSLLLRVKGYSSDGSVATGIVSIYRESLNFTGKNTFGAIGVWSSFPSELSTQDPFSDDYGLMARRAEARTSGEGWDRLTTDNGFWSNRFSPKFQKTASLMGPYLVVRGTFNPQTCDLQLTFTSTEVSPDGIRGAELPYLSLALYLPRADGAEGLAEAKYQNERATIFKRSPTVAFKGPTAEQRGQFVSQTVVISMNKEDFISSNDNGILAPEMLEMEIISEPRDGEVAPAQEMPTTPDGGTSDGGIPGLPEPQPEEMTPTA